MTPTASYYGFIYAIFALRRKPRGLIARSLGKKPAHGARAYNPTIATTVSCQPGKNPTDKTSLGERWYIPLSSTQSLYVVELELSLHTRLAH
jgi:hypothetical protein